MRLKLLLATNPSSLHSNWELIDFVGIVGVFGMLPPIIDFCIVAGVEFLSAIVLKFVGVTGYGWYLFIRGT